MKQEDGSERDATDSLSAPAFLVVDHRLRRGSLSASTRFSQRKLGGI
jgi:hypothetical protein